MEKKVVRLGCPRVFFSSNISRTLKSVCPNWFFLFSRELRDRKLENNAKSVIIWTSVFFVQQGHSIRNMSRSWVIFGGQHQKHRLIIRSNYVLIVKRKYNANQLFSMFLTNLFIEMSQTTMIFG